jgi:osmotically-inducible protein OsmY
MTRTAHRSDSDVFAAVKATLDRHPEIAQTVRVHVEAGTVTLTGSVRTAGETLETERVVRGVAGVERVINQLTVAQAVNAEGFEPPSRNGSRA